MQKSIVIIVAICAVSIGVMLAWKTNQAPERMASRSIASVDRPPQYVLLAFDGSKSLDFWKESLSFSESLNRSGTPLNFSYYISAVYFLHKGNTHFYTAPKHGKGRSAIGWSNSREDIASRIEWVNKAKLAGHEIGSHAAGHWDGGSWSASDWASEFSQFNQIVFGAIENNQFFEANRKLSWVVHKEDMKGFRAPLLAKSSGLWPTLKQFNFKYDTSETGQMDYWPQKKAASNTWIFPLANIPIVGTAKRTLSMDYNFFVANSKGVEESNPAKVELYYKQMLESYLNYFQNNYNGNRAPVHIGHHFSQWNKGAYWRAMKDFAKTVCGLKEVKCVTNIEFAEYLDTLTPQIIADYKAGQFQKSEPWKYAGVLGSPLDINHQLIFDAKSGKVSVALSGADYQKDISAYSLVWTLNGKVISKASLNLDLNQLGEKSGELSLVVKKGDLEVLTKTRKLSTDSHGGIILSSEDEEELMLKGYQNPQHHDLDEDKNPSRDEEIRQIRV